MKENQLRLLKSKIYLFGYNITTFANACNITTQNLYNKINGKRDFKKKEIVIISKILKLTLEEKEKIFFT
ncbi:hypothetical protein [Streptobacillus moniliformis]|uniref:hypothetical protein n=1 Tax=Streptobacillus moniliformis TaxID=34105 RepID=UPI0007E4ABE4|nr:hypothetical protein [Streptobacillus moniliformis]